MWDPKDGSGCAVEAGGGDPGAGGRGGRGPGLAGLSALLHRGPASPGPWQTEVGFGDERSRLHTWRGVRVGKNKVDGRAGREEGKSDPLAGG